MANWGLLMGLGQGIQQVGGMLEQRGKAQLADKLSQEKEARDQARRDREYERDQLSFSETKPELVDGIWMDVDYAKNGHRMDSRIASADKQQSLTAAMEKSKADAKKSALSIQKAELELADYGEDKGLARELTRARIQSARDTGLAALARAQNSGSSKAGGSTNSPSEMADVLVKSYSDIIKQVTTAGTGEEPLLTPAEVRRVASESVKIAAQRGQDAAAIFQEALRIRANGARRARSLELDLGK